MADGPAPLLASRLAQGQTRIGPGRPCLQHETNDEHPRRPRPPARPPRRQRMTTHAQTRPPPKSRHRVLLRPGKRESMAAANAVEGWIPAFAGMTEVRNLRLLRHMRSPSPTRGEGIGGKG